MGGGTEDCLGHADDGDAELGMGVGAQAGSAARIQVGVAVKYQQAHPVQASQHRAQRRQLAQVEAAWLIGRRCRHLGDAVGEQLAERGVAGHDGGRLGAAAGEVVDIRGDEYRVSLGRLNWRLPLGLPSVEPGERLLHGSSFGAAAAAYAEHRPDYAEAAVRWALEQAPGGPVKRVLDLGAGTGKLTSALVAIGLDVTAVEPDPAMLAELRRQLPDTTALAGSAESIPLPDQSVDAVLVGQALHWFDMTVAGPEIARVLVPGGVLAGLWNVDDDRVEWVAGLEQASEKMASATFSAWHTQAADAHLAEIDLPGFSTPERAEFPHGQRRTVDSLIATLATHSRLLVMDAQDRVGLLGRIRAYLESRPETAAGEFTLPMLTAVLRARRL